MSNNEKTAKRIFSELFYSNDRPAVERRTPEQIARPPGYYWVKARDKWAVEEWTGRDWVFMGSEDLESEDFGQIGPKIEPPEEL